MRERNSEVILKESSHGKLGNEDERKDRLGGDPIAEYLAVVGSDLASVKNPPNLDFSYLSDEQKAESMWALYKEARRLRPLSKFKEKRGMSKKDVSSEDKKKVQLILLALKELYGNDAVREIYLAQSGREKKEKTDINGGFEAYRDLTQKISTVEAEVDGCAKRIFGSRGKGASEIDVLLYESCHKQLGSYKMERDNVLANNGDLAALAEYQTLRGYSDQLRRENFIWSDSRRKLLEHLEAAAFSGQPVLLSGESGTGKTRLAEQAAIKLTGQVCNVTPGKDTRFQDLVAKPKISPTGETYFEYKEIGEAFTGRNSTLQEKPEHQGRIVADDEFNLLESAEQTGRLARVASWQPGKKVRMPVTNQEVIIAPNSSYWAMVNLASERYERKKIPPEVLRKFAKVDVGYPPQSAENPELYEMMLAALIDGNGRLRAPESEIVPEYEYEEKEEKIGKEGEQTKATIRIRQLLKNVEAGGFLWRFANAMGELNKSFSRQETILKAKGEAQFVRDLIIDMGKILGFLKQYAKMGQGQSLETFVIVKLKEQFLSQEAYSKEDRSLVKDFFRVYGIDVDSGSKIVSEFKNLSPVEVGLLSPRVEYRKILKQEIDVNEGSYIESDGSRVEFVQESYDFNGKNIVSGTILKGSDGKRIRYVGVRKDNGWPVFESVKEKGGTKKDTETDQEVGEITNSFAKLKAGLDQRAKEFGVKPPKLEMPAILSGFTKEHLAVFEQFLGNKLEASVVPEPENWDEYFRMMYPETQLPSDTQNNLILYQPTWWKQDIDKSIVGGKEKCGDAYRRSITAEAKNLAGRVLLTESIQKPNHIDGSQQYGTKDGLDSTQDSLLPVIEEVLGADKNRFNNNWEEVNQVAVKVKEKIIAKLTADKLAIPDFDVIITPAIIANLEMTIRHQENSSTSTYEWSSTPLLKQDNTDSGHRLMVGGSDDGGAGCVNGDRRGGRWNGGGFRLSVVLKNT